MLEEVHQQADFVERQPHDVDLICDGQGDFRPKLAAAEDAWDLAVLIPWAAIDFIGDEHRLAVLQPPYRPRVRQSAVSFPHARRKDFLGTHGLGNLLRTGGPPGLWPPLSLPPLLSSRLLPPFFCLHRERLRNLRRRWDAQLLFQLLDPLFRRVQLPLRGHDQFDQPTDADFPRLNIFLELLNIHATLIADFPKSGSASFTEWTATWRPWAATPCLRCWRR